MTNEIKKYCEGLDCAICNEKEPCIYKIANELEEKLLRKEQECKNDKIAYKTELDIYNQECLNLQEELKEAFEQLDQLKAENDNLKSLIWWIHIGAEGADKATTEYYENRNTPYEENYWKRIRALQPPTYESKYKLALAEIKEFAENFCRESSPYKDDEYDICVEDCFLDEIVNPILQKISEVEDEHNG